MSSVEEINALRQELADRQAARKAAEVDNVDVRRQQELETEAEKLRRQIAEEDAVAELLAGAGQVEEKTEGRTDEEILFAAGVATAVANGATQEEVDAAVAEASKVQTKDESVKTEAPKPVVTPTLTTGTVNTGASKEEEK